MVMFLNAADKMEISLVNCAAKQDCYGLLRASDPKGECHQSWPVAATATEAVSAVVTLV